MRFRIIATTTAVATMVTLFAWREVCLSRKIETLHQDREQWVADRQSLNDRLDLAEEKLARTEIPSFSESGKASPALMADVMHPVQRIAAMEAQLITALENQTRALQLVLDHNLIGLVIPEYDPTHQALEAQSATNALRKRGWGTEQVTGPPDTTGFGNAPTAWSPLKANAGDEWLAVSFDQAVEVAEVRIRETSNPGAISKVTAVVNNEEVTLWEGTAAQSNTPRDFVVPVPEGVQTDSVVVHVDTTRVDSRTEIDAVELVGRNGSRQWATSAKASSTYADTTARPSPETTY